MTPLGAANALRNMDDEQLSITFLETLEKQLPENEMLKELKNIKEDDSLFHSSELFCKYVLHNYSKSLNLYKKRSQILMISI